MGKKRRIKSARKAQPKYGGFQIDYANLSEHAQIASRLASNVLQEELLRSQLGLEEFASDCAASVSSLLAILEGKIYDVLFKDIPAIIGLFFFTGRQEFNPNRLPATLLSRGKEQRLARFEIDLEATLETMIRYVESGHTPASVFFGHTGNPMSNIDGDNLAALINGVPTTSIREQTNNAMVMGGPRLGSLSPPYATTTPPKGGVDEAGEHAMTEPTSISSASSEVEIVVHSPPRLKLVVTASVKYREHKAQRALAYWMQQNEVSQGMLSRQSGVRLSAIKQVLNNRIFWLTMDDIASLCLRTYLPELDPMTLPIVEYRDGDVTEVREPWPADTARAHARAYIGAGHVIHPDIPREWYDGTGEEPEPLAIESAPNLLLLLPEQDGVGGSVNAIDEVDDERPDLSSEFGAKKPARYPELEEIRLAFREWLDAHDFRDRVKGGHSSYLRFARTYGIPVSVFKQFLNGYAYPNSAFFALLYYVTGLALLHPRRLPPRFNASAQAGTIARAMSKVDWQDEYLRIKREHPEFPCGIDDSERLLLEASQNAQESIQETVDLSLRDMRLANIELLLADISQSVTGITPNAHNAQLTALEVPASIEDLIQLLAAVLRQLRHYYWHPRSSIRDDLRENDEVWELIYELGIKAKTLSDPPEKREAAIKLQRGVKDQEKVL